MTIVTRTSSTRTRMASAIAVVLAAGFGLTALPASAGPIGWQASAGWYTESDDFFVSAGARLGLGTLTVTPNAEWLFVDGGSTYTLNLDGTMSVLPLGVASGYVGAGVGLFTVDPKGGDSNSDTVINLIAGAGINAVPLKPFGHFKWVVADGDDPLVFSLGVRF